MWKGSYKTLRHELTSMDIFLGRVANLLARFENLWGSVKPSRRGCGVADIWDYRGMGSAKDSLPTVVGRQTQWFPFCRWPVCLIEIESLAPFLLPVARGHCSKSQNRRKCDAATAVICNIWRTIGLLAPAPHCWGKVSLNDEWVKIFRLLAWVNFLCHQDSRWPLTLKIS